MINYMKLSPFSSLPGFASSLVSVYVAVIWWNGSKAWREGGGGAISLEVVVEEEELLTTFLLYICYTFHCIFFYMFQLCSKNRFCHKNKTDRFCKCMLKAKSFHSSVLYKKYKTLPLLNHLTSVAC